MRGYLDGDVMECGDHGRDCLGIGEIYVQKCFIEPSGVEMCYLQGVDREDRRADGQEKVEDVIRWFYASIDVKRDPRIKKYAQLTLRTKWDLEHEGNPRQEPRAEGLRESPPVNIP